MSKFTDKEAYEKWHAPGEDRAVGASDSNAPVSRDDFEVSQFKDGSLVLTCGKDGMESDLVFASGAMAGDPVLDKQAAILDFIMRAVSQYDG